MLHLPKAQNVVKYIHCFGPLAQQVEQGTLNPLAAGSSPARVTSFELWPFGQEEAGAGYILRKLLLAGKTVTVQPSSLPLFSFPSPLAFGGGEEGKKKDFAGRGAASPPPSLQNPVFNPIGHKLLSLALL